MLVLVIAYPILVHLGVLLANATLQWLALICLLAIPLYKSLTAPSLRAWVTLLVSAIILFFIIKIGHDFYALYLPPVMLPASMLIIFGRSLRSGQIPLITRIAAAERGTLEPRLLVYTRVITQIWVFLIAFITLDALLLALFAPIEIWSLFTNFINYGLCGALFVGEYIFRRWHFRDLSHPTFLQHILVIARTDYRNL